MAMADVSEANSQRQNINLNFYVSDQTINLTITPALASGNNSSRDSFNITQRHKIYAFTIPVFIGLLQIQSQGNTTSLFIVHPVTTTAGVLCILGYYLAFTALLSCPSHATQSSIAMGVFGTLSLASLVTLLLPDSWWHVKCIVYSLLAVVDLHQLLKVLYHKYVTRFIRSFISSWPSSSQRRRLLPLSNMDLS